jgi:hypothetical protein
MKIDVTRIYKKELYTIGEMKINGTWFCNTLEDKDRGMSQELSASQNKKLKVYGQTAIPTGTYTVTVTWWPKYRLRVPLLHNVPAFDGILIHNGVNQNHTLGCILVGLNKERGKLTDGKRFMNELTNKVDDATKRGETTTITIK